MDNMHEKRAAQARLGMKARPRISAGAGPGFKRRLQCEEALAAPRPVSERTCCAAKAAFSCSAPGLPSSREKSQTPIKPMVMENSAGEV